MTVPMMAQMPQSRAQGMDQKRHQDQRRYQLDCKRDELQGRAADEKLDHTVIRGCGARRPAALAKLGFL